MTKTEKIARELYGWNPKSTSLSADEFISLMGGDYDDKEYPMDIRDTSPFNPMERR